MLLLLLATLPLGSAPLAEAPVAGAFEIRLGIGFGAAPEARDDPTLEYQRWVSRVGFDWAIDDRFTAELEVAAVAARQASSIGINFHHRGLGDLRMAGWWHHGALQLGVSGTAPLGREEDGFPAVDDGRPSVGAQAGWAHPGDDWSLLLRAGPAWDFDRARVDAHGFGSALYRLHRSIEIGPYFEAQRGRIRLGMIETLGGRDGLSVRMLVHRDVFADGVEALDAVEVALAWRG